MIQRISLENSMNINVKHELNKHNQTILFLHFSGGTLHMWNGVFPLFENEYNIIAPDFRGHGESDKPPTGYHIDDMAHDIVLLLRELKVSKCHIVGSSMGAEVALSIAASHPDLVSSIICEGALCNEFGPLGLFNGSKEEIIIEKNRQNIELKKRVMPMHESRPDYVEELVQSFKKQGFYNEYFSRFIDSCIEESAEGFYTSHYRNHVRIEYIQKYWELRFEDYYKRVTCPILFLPSSEEWQNETIKKSLAAFTSHLHKYEISHIKDSVHAYVWMQQPKIAGIEVKRFIESI
ncbi:alpha/beta fold hydrolase [Bacillus sp. AK128]